MLLDTRLRASYGLWKPLGTLLKPLGEAKRPQLDRLASRIEPEGVLDLGSTGTESASPSK